MLKFLCGDEKGLGNDEYGRWVEDSEQVEIGVEGGIKGGYDKQYGRHQHEDSVLKRETYYLIQHSY